jgi:hypothetical protein
MESLHPSEGVLLGLVLVSAWGVLFLLYQIIKQQGRLLLRLDGIEQHWGILAPASRPAVTASEQGTWPRAHVEAMG